MRGLWLLACLLTFSGVGCGVGVMRAQVPDMAGYYVPPVKMDPMTLSGTLGEFRSNHFHGGTDFRVGGVVGAPIYAVADGYVSRITVAPNGYGNALYITHPNGTVSVYGHLDRYASSIAAYVVQAQYEAQSFSVDLHPDPTQFPVTKGQQVGRAGNTGDSAGPHLHFELRYVDATKTASPAGNEFSANIFNHGIYAFADTQPPVFRRVQFYAYATDARRFAHTQLITALDATKNEVRINVSDTFYVAVDATDRMDGTYAKLGIERWEVWIDSTLAYAYDNKDVPLVGTRYINSLFEYPQRVRYGRNLLKTWVEPGNGLTDHITAPTGGLFALPDSLAHQLKIVVADAAGHRAERRYTVQREQGLYALVPQQEPVGYTEADSLFAAEEYTQTFFWDTDNYFAAEGLKVALTAGSLYKNIPFCATRLSEEEWLLYTSDEALHKPLIMQFALPASLPDSLHAKTVALRQNDQGLGMPLKTASPEKWSCIGGSVEDGQLTVRSSSFGRFKIDVDTLAPSVTPSFTPGADIRSRTAIRFTLRDERSGIGSYNVWIDGSWYLFTYDAKTFRITGALDPKRLKRGTRHHVEVEVADSCQNTTRLEAEFVW